MNITALAVRRPVATSMVFIALSLLGAVSYYLLPVQLLPNLVFPQLQMVVWMPGATSEEVEENLSDSGEFGLDDVDVAEAGVFDMMIYIDPERDLRDEPRTLGPGSSHIRALEEYCHVEASGRR